MAVRVRIRGPGLRLTFGVESVMNMLSTIGHGLKLLLVPLALAGLAACASPFRADVSRFATQLPAPAGQTFTVVADDPALAGGLEFHNYAQHVADRMAALGYTPVNDPATADLVVSFDYGIDTGRERVRSTGFSDPWWGPWYGYRPYYRGYGYRGYYAPYGPWGWGWNSSWYNDVRSYTIYTSGIEMKIDRRADGQRLFEGRAQAISTSNRLQYLVPNLVDAMFTGFPGNSGETVRISIAPENQVVQRNSGN
jgi:hypothetical protein